MQESVRLTGISAELALRLVDRWGDVEGMLDVGPTYRVQVLSKDFDSDLERGPGGRVTGMLAFGEGKLTPFVGVSAEVAAGHDFVLSNGSSQVAGRTPWLWVGALVGLAVRTPFPSSGAGLHR